MNDKLVRHIKNRLEEKNEIRDGFEVPTDDVVKYVMLMTFEVVESDCRKCYFCQNYSRFNIFSRCKIKHHPWDNCFHFTLNVNRVMKKKYYKIMIGMSEATRGRHLRHELCPAKTKKNIIYESIRLYEAICSYNEVMRLSPFDHHNIEGPVV